LEYAVVSVEYGNSRIDSGVEEHHPFVSSFEADGKTELVLYLIAERSVFFLGGIRLLEPHRVDDAMD
jgi:hypothetical protein